MKIQRIANIRYDTDFPEGVKATECSFGAEEPLES